MPAAVPRCARFARAGPGAEPVVIDLGPIGTNRLPPGPPMSRRMRRGLIAGLVAVLSLVALGGSAAGVPTGLDRPLWTGTVSLNGFTLGPRSLYEATTDARTVIGRDLATGRPRWSLGIDRADLPDVTTDVGHGVAAVMTRRLAQEPERPVYTVTFVREGTGAAVARTDGYVLRPGADGVPLLVFTDRSADSFECSTGQMSCVDVAAWDLETATVRWRLHLPAGTVALPSFGWAGRLDGLAEVAADGTVRLRDIRTGGVSATMRLSPAHLADGHVQLTSDALVAALRHGNEIVVTGYRRPTLAPAWSVAVPAPIDPNSQDYTFRGGLQLYPCGAGFVCLHQDRQVGRIIATRTGQYSGPLPYPIIFGFGDGVFLTGTPSENSPSPVHNGQVVDRMGRRLATLTDVEMVPWEDSGDRVLVYREGRAGTEFVVWDGRGRRRTMGTVAGTGLACQARGRFLSCSDSAGVLRTWRMPAWATAP